MINTAEAITACASLCSLLAELYIIELAECLIGIVVAPNRNQDAHGTFCDIVIAPSLWHLRWYSSEKKGATEN